MKSKKKTKPDKKLVNYKLPASAKEEPEIKQHSKYEEEPIVKGKTHYQEEEVTEM